MSLLKAEKLWFAYDKDDVIKDVSLDFGSGSITVLIGLNGSGKTTLIKLMAGILKPVRGHVFVGMRDLKTMPYLERSTFISYVSQGIDVGNDHDVKDYLSFGLMNRLRFNASPSAQHWKLVTETADKFGIKELLDRPMSALSGGQKQIASICRAFIQDTHIMILDEPTSALDFKNQYLVLNVLKEVAESGKSIIMSTHNPNHALFMNSHAVLLDQGEIMNAGEARHVVNAEVLRPIYGERIVTSKELPYDEITISGGQHSD
jgi:iron complex transport system ATP-binding protein